MAELPANWDSSGAVPISAQAVAAAWLLIEAVAEAQDRLRREGRAPRTSAPMPDGGVQVAWRGRAARIEVWFAPEGGVGCLIEEEADSPVEEADGASFDVVPDAVTRVLAT